MVLSHFLGFLGTGARKKVTLLLAAQRSSWVWLLCKQEGGVASSWSRAAGDVSVGFAETEPKCDRRVDGDTPADVLLWVVRNSLPRTSKLPAGNGDKNLE